VVTRAALSGQSQVVEPSVTAGDSTLHE